MFKKLFVISLTVALLIGIGGVTLAQDELITAETDMQTFDEAIDQKIELDQIVTAEELGIKEPTLLPDSRFYFLKNWSRGIRKIFTFNKTKKAELELRYSSEKLLEARKLADKKKKPEILDKATDKYKESIDRIKNAVDRIKGNASTNPRVGIFLDKFTKQSILHQKILDKLETKVPTSTMTRIRQAREKHLEGFGQIMDKLETNKELIRERIENSFKAIRGSDFQDFQNMEILKRFEERAPEAVKEKIREVRDSQLEKFKEKLELMTPIMQEQLQLYIQRTKGDASSKMEILEDIKARLPINTEIRQRLDSAQTQIIERIRKDASDNISRGSGVCIALWDPVCGVNGKTYSNKCRADLAGIIIRIKGACPSLVEPSLDNNEIESSTRWIRLDAIDVQAEPVR